MCSRQAFRVGQGRLRLPGRRHPRRRRRPPLEQASRPGHRARRRSSQAQNEATFRLPAVVLLRRRPDPWPGYRSVAGSTNPSPGDPHAGRGARPVDANSELNSTGVESVLALQGSADTVVVFVIRRTLGASLGSPPDARPRAAIHPPTAVSTDHCQLLGWQHYHYFSLDCHRRSRALRRARQRLTGCGQTQVSAETPTGRNAHDRDFPHNPPGMKMAGAPIFRSEDRRFRLGLPSGRPAACQDTLRF